MVVSALELAAEVDPYQKDIPEGTVIRAVDALKWRPGQNQCDIRPRLLDKSTGINRLVDTGSQISVTKKGPDDILDESIKLVAVNGTRIPTYGIKEVVIKINRKSYKIPAVVCDVQQDILGMDFIAKYRLNFEWDEFDELNIVDRKAQIRAPLQVVTVKSNTPRTSYLDAQSEGQSEVQGWRSSQTPDMTKPQVSPEAVAFQVACMKQLDPSAEKSPKKKLSVEEQLALHSQEYADLIRSYPQLLNPSFKKGEPDHGVYHRIETGSHPPCRTKRRPITSGSKLRVAHF